MSNQQRVGNPEDSVAGFPRALPPALSRLPWHREAELHALLAASREREHRLNQEVTALVDALTEKDHLVASVSHEFRTPLTSIIGSLDLLRVEAAELSPSALRWLEAARRNATRLSALVSDFLVSADSSLPVHPRRTDLASLVEASLVSAHGFAEAARVSLSIDVPAPLWAEVDPLRISQVLDNLVSNAVKYTPDGGTVHVSASNAGARVMLHVKDDGIGMTAADAERVFSRFFRSAAVSAGSIPGTGLGLSITKAIVEQHGGSIAVRTSPGCGSTFTVELPAGAPLRRNSFAAERLRYWRMARVSSARASSPPAEG